MLYFSFILRIEEMLFYIEKYIYMFFLVIFKIFKEIIVLFDFRELF